MTNHPAGEEPIKVPRFEESVGFYTTKQRSYNMSQIKGKNSKPELMLRKALWSKNLRFRLHDKALPGKPDIVIKKYRLVFSMRSSSGTVTIGKRYKHQIKSNKAFWIPKIERNMQKDRIDHQGLRDMGYTVFRF